MLIQAKDLTTSLTVECGLDIYQVAYVSERYQEAGLARGDRVKVIPSDSSGVGPNLIYREKDGKTFSTSDRWDQPAILIREDKVIGELDIDAAEVNKLKPETKQREIVSAYAPGEFSGRQCFRVVLPQGIAGLEIGDTVQITVMRGKNSPTVLTRRNRDGSINVFQAHGENNQYVILEKLPRDLSPIDLPEPYASYDDIWLLRQIAKEHDETKQMLRNAGFGVTGTPLPETVKEALVKLSGFPEEPQASLPESSVTVTMIGQDGRCKCNAAAWCPLGKTGTRDRCTEAELNIAGIQTIHDPPKESSS